MDDGVLWGACDPQPLQQTGIFNGAESQASLLSCHAESPYPQYWTDEIALMSSSLVDPLAFDPVLNLPAVAGDSIHHDLAGGNSKFPHQQGQWGHNLGSADFYPTPDVHEILNSQFMQFNSSPHLPQDFNNFHKTFGTITPVQHSRPVTSTNAPAPLYGGSCMPPSHNRAVGSTNAQYGGSPVVPNSIGMFAPTIPLRIISTSGMDGGCNSNMLHLPKRHPLPLAPKTVGNVAVADCGNMSTVPGAQGFVANQKCTTSGLMSLADSPHMHKRDCVAEEPKMASFNPGPFVPTQKQQHEQQESHRMWLENNNRGKSSAVPIPNSGHRHQQAMSNSSPVTNLGFEQRPQLAMSNSSPVINMGFEQRHQQAMSNSSPVTNLGYDPRHQQAMSNSSPSTNLGFESRHQKSLSNSSPATRMGFEQQRPKQLMTSSSPVPTIVGFEPSQQHQQQPMPSSSPVPIMGFEQGQQHQPMTSSFPIPVSGFEQRQQQQQPMSSPSPTPNLGFEQRLQPTMSTSPPLSNLSFEPRQPPPPPMSSSPSTSNLVFEPRRQQPIGNPSPISNLARQQPPASNPRSAVADSGESAPKWPALLMVGGSTGVPGSEKAPIMRQQPETGTIKCALPRNTSANSSPGANANTVNKRPLWADDNKNQGGSMNKKPMQKWQGSAGCSRLEEISAAAHQKVTQNTSGRALGPALNTNLKPRARQGSANDPQSIAARVRRERISERLKVLQTLIPNGDKVDMVTMLEKAINYVQCLELQIRMLKNDSLWPKALGPLPNTFQELLELAGPDFLGVKDAEETTTPEKTRKTPEVIEFDGNQPSADKE